MGKMEINWKENHATKVTKISKTKYGMNKTHMNLLRNSSHDLAILPVLAKKYKIFCNFSCPNNWIDSKHGCFFFATDEESMNWYDAMC